MLTIDTLRDLGADVESGLGRCLNNEAFYLRLVKMALEDASFDKLAAAVDGGDAKGAFEAAHSLKGVLGNLSLTPLYKPASEITELLRGGTEADVSAQMAELREQRSRLLALCE